MRRILLQPTLWIASTKLIVVNKQLLSCSTHELDSYTQSSTLASVPVLSCYYSRQSTKNAVVYYRLTCRYQTHPKNNCCTTTTSEGQGTACSIETLAVHCWDTPIARQGSATPFTATQTIVCSPLCFKVRTDNHSRRTLAVCAHMAIATVDPQS